MSLQARITQLAQAIATDIKALQYAGGGPGAVGDSGLAVLDFGGGANEASVSVTAQAAILASSQVNAWVGADDTSSSHSASDHRYFAALAGLSCGTPGPGVGFEIYARSTEKLTGTFTVRWSWAN